MPDTDLLPSLLFKINENELALEKAIMELTNCVEQRGSAEVADNVRGALAAIDRNGQFIKMTLAVLNAGVTLSADSVQTGLGLGFKPCSFQNWTTSTSVLA